MDKDYLEYTGPVENMTNTEMREDIKLVLAEMTREELQKAYGFLRDLLGCMR